MDPPPLFFILNFHFIHPQQDYELVLPSNMLRRGLRKCDDQSVRDFHKRLRTSCMNEDAVFYTTPSIPRKIDSFLGRHEILRNFILRVN